MTANPAKWAAWCDLLNDHAHSQRWLDAEVLWWSAESGFGFVLPTGLFFVCVCVCVCVCVLPTGRTIASACVSRLAPADSYKTHDVKFIHYTRARLVGTVTDSATVCDDRDVTAHACTVYVKSTWRNIWI